MRLRQILSESSIIFCFSKLRGRKYLFFEILSYSDERTRMRDMMVAVSKMYRMLLVRELRIFNKIVCQERILSMKRPQGKSANSHVWMFSGGVKDYHLHIEIKQSHLKDPDFKSLVNLKKEQTKLKSLMPVIACLEIDLIDHTNNA